MPNDGWRRSILCVRIDPATAGYYFACMAMQISDVVQAIDSVAPFTSAASWDAVGLQLGDPGRTVERIGVVHELTPAVMIDVIDRELELVVAYHPLIFRPLASITAAPGSEGRSMKLVEHGVSVIAVHTNWDVASGGTSDALAGALSLEDAVGFGSSDGDLNLAGRTMEHVGRIGTFADSVDDVIDLVSSRLGATPRTAGVFERPVERLAVLPGSGGSFIDAARNSGANVLVTGDVSHHEARFATDLGLCVIDAGHAATERPGVQALYAAVVDSVGTAIDLTGVDVNPWEGGQ